ncbi:MAG: hypothetical protein EPO68_10740 [Planctomycetota bacterium]|nr:MAG: hypothetical protein EPO68_10740 [Planctomycetota bacterium]
MRRLLFALLALVALLVALAAWWASHPADPAAGARAGLAPELSAAGAARLAASAEADGTGDSADGAAAASARAAAQRSATTRREGRRIRVVDARTGAPLPAASAWWMSLEANGRWLESDRVERGLDVETAWRTHGNALALDENAEAELPRELVDAVRVAALGELGGAQGELGRAALGYDERAFPRERTDVVELRLARQQHVDAFVVDADGRPAAGIPVGLADLGWSDAETLIVRTDADGRARIRGVTRWLEKVRQPAMLGIVAPLDPVPFVRGLPERPVTLTLPPCGALRVRARVDTAAGAVDPQARPSLSAALLKDVGTGVLPIGLRVVDWDGEIGPLQAGAPILLEGALAHWESLQLQLEPLAPGETRDVDVVFGAPQPVLVARVLGPDGAPRANELLALRLTNRTGAAVDRAPLLVATDARARVTLAERELAGDDARVIELSTQDGALAASTPIPHPLAGYRDLGDLVLRAAPLVAAGRVVDALGAPIEDAELTVWIADAEPGASAPTQIQARSAANGRFELRGELAAEPSALVATSERRYARITSADGLCRGALDLVIALPDSAEVAGRVELPAGLPAELVLVRIAPTAGAAHPVELKVSRDGSFRTDLAAAGIARLEVLVLPCRERLAVLDALLLPPNGRASDERLDPLRLARIPELVRVRVVDAQGQPRSGLLRSHESSSATGSAASHAFFRGELVAPRICEASRFVVAVPGCTEQELDLAHPPKVLVFAQAARIALEIHAAGLPEETNLRLRATRAGAPTHWMYVQPGEVTEFSAPAPGRWDLHCTLSVRSGNIRLEEDVPCEPAWIEVGPDRPTHCVLRFDSAAAQALLAGYRR